MTRRVEGKVVIVVGGGQTPGETIGNGRATAILLAREGAQVVVADQNLSSTQETVDMIGTQERDSVAMAVDVTSEEAVRELIDGVVARYGRLDILHNNVGAGLSLGDAPVPDITEEVLDRIIAVNFKGMWLTCKHALPHLRETGHASIVNISSMAARHEYPRVGYKTTKAAVIALTENIAAANATYGVRANAILPGKINTPIAIEARVADGTGAGRCSCRPRQDGPSGQAGDCLGRGLRCPVPPFRRGRLHNRHLSIRRWRRGGDRRRRLTRVLHAK